MSRLIKTLIVASASLGALLVSACSSLPGPVPHDGAEAAMANHECMMMAQRSGGAAGQAMPMKCEMNCNCPMMQKKPAADASTPPAAAQTEEHNHAPDTPSAAH